jgi:hypothetical protein
MNRIRLEPQLKQNMHEEALKLVKPDDSLSNYGVNYTSNQDQIPPSPTIRNKMQRELEFHDPANFITTENTPMTFIDNATPLKTPE